MDGRMEWCSLEGDDREIVARVLRGDDMCAEVEVWMGWENGMLLRRAARGAFSCVSDVRLLGHMSSFMHVSVYLEQSHHTCISNNSFWGFG